MGVEVGDRQKIEREVGQRVRINPNLLHMKILLGNKVEISGFFGDSINNDVSLGQICGKQTRERMFC